MTTGDIQALLHEATQLWQSDRLNEAKECYARVIELDAASAEAWTALGQIQWLLGDYAEAGRCFQALIDVSPGDAQAHYFLGTCRQEQHDVQSAIACFRRALELKPDYPEVSNDLGAVLLTTGAYDEAAEIFTRLSREYPNQVSVHYNLGLARRDQKRFAEAVECFRACLRINPNLAEAYYSLGHVEYSLRQYQEAEAHLRRAIELSPKLSDAHFNLAIVLLDVLRPCEAEQFFRQALAIKPDFPDYLHGLGNALLAQGRAEEAADAYRKVLSINPALASTHSNLLLILHYRSNHSPEELLTEHVRFAEQHMPVRSEAQEFRNTPDPSRRLRVGYVSADFRIHSVAHFIRALFAHHDPQSIETICYADVPHTDAMSSWFQQRAGLWRAIHDMADETVANLIRDDEVDILVDLSGHTGGSRLGVFAFKPAPVQVTYLGYPDTTGMKQIDYRLTDAWADPPGSEAHYVEKLVRLPRGFLCFTSPGDLPAVLEPPCQANGFVTFGSFNNIAKLSPEAIALWSSVLAAVPGARLLLKSRAFQEKPVAERYYALFEQHGIARDRLELNTWTVNLRDHFGQYARVDIALDTFPYNGTTTTCEALSMGVPVVTLAGQNHAGRVGSSLLSQVGLTDCIAPDADSYRIIASDLARDTNRLMLLRGGLREQMAASSLCNADAFARDVEAAYREIWLHWCDSRRTSAAGTR
jgi:predicted O-linked N-acetylglucosamine transferase (SPINDLY family)